MANFKVVVSDPKSKKAFQKDIEQKASGFIGKKIGDNLKGDSLGFSGYEFEVTGGSDAQGFPMRKDFDGQARKRLLLSYGPGFKPRLKGQRKRKSVRGNTISASISQINVKIVTYGSKPMAELSAAGEKAEKKAKPSEEEKKTKLQQEVAGMVEEKAPEKSRSEQILEEQAKEAKPEAPKEEKPKEEKPEEPKPEKEAAKKEEKPKEEPDKKEAKDKTDKKG